MEHKLIDGGEKYLPFARKQIKGLRATGLKYGTQKFVFPDDLGKVSVSVKIAGDQDYINIKGPSLAKLYVLLVATCNDMSGSTVGNTSHSRSKYHMLIGFDGLSLNRKRYRVMSSSEETGTYNANPSGSEKSSDLSMHLTVLDDIIPAGGNIARVYLGSKYEYYSRSVMGTGIPGTDFIPGSDSWTRTDTISTIRFGGYSETFSTTESQKSDTPVRPIPGPTVTTTTYTASFGNSASVISLGKNQLTVAVTPYGGAPTIKTVEKISSTDPWTALEDSDQTIPASLGDYTKSFKRVPNTPAAGDPFTYMSGIHVDIYDYPNPPETTNYKVGFHPIPTALGGNPANPAYTRRQVGSMKQGYNWIQYTHWNASDGSDTHSLVFRDRSLSEVPSGGSTVTEILSGNQAKALRYGPGSVAVTKDYHLGMRFRSPTWYLQLISQAGLYNNWDYVGGAGYTPSIVKEINLLQIPEVAAHPIFSVALASGVVPDYGNDMMTIGFSDGSTGIARIGTLMVKIRPDLEALMDPNMVWYDPAKDD